MSERALDDREITVLTNIPNHHNGFLYDELRGLERNLVTVYKGLPETEGRPWRLEVQPPDRIADSIRGDLRHDRSRWADGSWVILSGSWATPRDALRRAATVVARRRGVHVAMWGETMSDSGGLRDAARRLYFARPGLDAILAIGTAAAPSYRRATRGHLPIHVFPYTTSLGLGVPNDRTETPTIGAVARLIPLKGLDLLIEAVASIPRSTRPNLELVGSGPCRAELQQLAERRSVEVTFHGELDAAAAVGVRSRWSLSVLPCRSLDGWGLVVPESLNQGVPVLVSEHVGASELVRDRWNGGRVPIGAVEQPEVWAERIVELLAAPADLLAERSRQVGQAFSSAPAARWLTDNVLDGDWSIERSFVDDAWTSVGAEGDQSFD